MRLLLFRSVPGMICNGIVGMKYCISCDNYHILFKEKIKHTRICGSWNFVYLHTLKNNYIFKTRFCCGICSINFTSDHKRE